MRISDWSADVCSSDLAFSRDIAAGGSGQVQVLVDGRRSNAGQIVVGYLSSITADIGADVNPTAAPPLAVRHWFNPNLVYRWFIVPGLVGRSEEQTSELQSLMRNSYAVFCLKKKNTQVT